MSGVRIYSAIAALIGWLALGLQLYLSFDGSGALHVVVRYLSFFTISTNILVALVFTAEAARARVLSIFLRAPVQTAIAGYILVVMVVYELLLRATWSPQGLQLIVDTALHDVMPVLYLVFWTVWTRKAGLRWALAAVGLIYPAAYMAYSLARGAMTGVYPYFFIDVGELGMRAVLLNAVGLLAAFLAVGLAFVGLAKFMAHRPASAA